MTRNTDYGVTGRTEGSHSIKRVWKLADEQNANQHPAGGEWIPIHAIEVRRGLTPRAHEAPAEVAEAYATAWDALPPITVQRDTLILIDGYHRMLAAPLRISDLIRAVQVDVSEDELADEAVRLNVAHGVRLSAEERQRAVRGMLKRHPDWSNGRIAEWCGASERTVVTVRGKMLASQEIAATKQRLGADGRVQPDRKAPGVAQIAPHHPSSDIGPDIEEDISPPAPIGVPAPARRTPRPASRGGQGAAKKPGRGSSFDPGPEPANDDVAPSYEGSDGEICERCNHLDIAHRFTSGCHGQVLTGGRLRNCGCTEFASVAAEEPEPRVDRTADEVMARTVRLFFEAVGSSGMSPVEWVAFLRRYPTVWVAACRAADDAAKVVEAVRQAATEAVPV